MHEQATDQAGGGCMSKLIFWGSTPAMIVSILNRTVDDVEAVGLLTVKLLR